MKIKLKIYLSNLNFSLLRLMRQTQKLDITADIKLQA